MATFITNRQVDFSQTTGFFDAGPASILSATSTQITVKAPNGHTQIYEGSFSYTYSGGYQYFDWNNSFLTGIKDYAISGSFVGSITGMSVSGAVWKSYADADDGDGFKAYMFRGNDSISGSSYNDVLWGYEGNDILNGRAGNDFLDGGAGTDTMLGGTGNDTYFVNTAGDVVTEGVNSGIDTVNSSINYTLGVNLENLTLTGTAAINGIGNTLGNTLTGNSGNNILNGGAGNDTMLGGLGNDTYLVNSAGDVVTEEVGQGADTVKSVISYTLGANLEYLALVGTLAINGTGNILNNNLQGNSAANTLNGGGGNDILNGNLGNDSLTGGAGKDTFVFNGTLDAATNNDTITDFIAINDTIRLDHSVFTSLTTTGTLAADNFRSSTTGTAADANDFILYNRSTGALLYDADGSGTGGAIQFATLTTHPIITAADFFVV